MRTIKFRAKSVHEDKWVYGFFVGDNDEPTIVGFDIYRDGSEEWREEKIELDTLGQFTGLYDKEGKEIYEGDIIYSEFNDGSNANCLVGWNDSYASFGIMDDYEYKSKLQGYEFPSFSSTILHNFTKNSKIFKVIGNIHDNPELINK